MDFTHLTAAGDDEGRRLDKVLRKYLDASSLSSLYKSLRSGLIKVNGKKEDASYRLSSGDDIQIATFLTSRHSEKKTGHALDSSLILFRNEHFLVLNKPYDLPSQDGGSGKSLSSMVAEDWQSTEHPSLSFSPAPLHRLDKKTTGVLVCSQSIEGARYFSEKIQSHEARKVYLAIVEGRLESKEHWEDYLSEAEQKGGRFFTVKVTNAADGKLALTDAIPLARGSYKGRDLTLVQVEILTGRHHQIRCQAAYHGHPLLGDRAYGAAYGEKDLFLHAFRMSFPDNNGLGLPCEITAPISTKFQKMLESTLIKWDGRIKIN